MSESSRKVGRGQTGSMTLPIRLESHGGTLGQRCQDSLNASRQKDECRCTDDTVGAARHLSSQPLAASGRPDLVLCACRPISAPGNLPRRHQTVSEMPNMANCRRPFQRNGLNVHQSRRTRRSKGVSSCLTSLHVGRLATLTCHTCPMMRRA